MIQKTPRKRIPATNIPASIPEKKRGPKPRVVIEFPEPSSTTWTDCNLFHEAHAMHMERYNESGLASEKWRVLVLSGKR